MIVENQHHQIPNVLLRHSLRCPINGSVSIFDRETHQHIGLMIDISETLLTLTSPIAIENHEMGKFKMVDMPNNSDFKRVGCFDARTVACHRISPSIYNVDLEFIRISEETRLMMSTYKHIV